jgi:hypothetical protein
VVDAEFAELVEEGVEAGLEAVVESLDSGEGGGGVLGQVEGEDGGGGVAFVVQPRVGGDVTGVGLRGVRAIEGGVEQAVFDSGEVLRDLAGRGVREGALRFVNFVERVMRKPCWSLLAGVVACLPLSARGAVIASDDFESYAAGSQLSGQSGATGFTGPYAVTAANSSNVTVVNKSLSYSGGIVGVNGGSNAVQVAGVADSNDLIVRPIATQSGSPVYFGFLYSTNSTTEAFLQFGLENGSAGDPNASVGVQGNAANGTGAEGFFARVPNAPATTVHASSGITAGTTYYVVGRISKGAGSSTYNTVDLFVNPTSLDESSPTLTATNVANAGVSSFNNFVLCTARTDAGSLYDFDNLTIGTTFADVVPTPEPGCLGLLGLSGLGLLRRSRRRA